LKTNKSQRDATIADMHTKKWHIRDLSDVQPRNDAQHMMFRAASSDNNIIASGTAGTGKSYLAMYLALRALLTEGNVYDKIRIVRSAVSTRDIGHMPGTMEEKIQDFEAPYRDICKELIGRWSTYDDMKDAHLIKFNVTSNIRGLTWPSEIVILEEVENLNFHEIDSVLTRIGKNTKIIITGDVKQTDLLKTNKDTTGMHKLLKIAESMNSFDVVNFTTKDIVRSDFVREWIEATEATEW